MDDIDIDDVLREMEDSIDDYPDKGSVDYDRSYDKLFIESGIKPLPAYHFSF